MLDLVEETVTVRGRGISILRPRDSEALLDEEAFEIDEYLPYWAELWPSSIALAEALAAHPLAGTRVLELGCGLGLPAVAAALRGAEVTAVDWSPEAVRAAAANAARNGARVEVRRWSWSAPAGELRAPRWPLVVAADVLYERRNAPALLKALRELVAPGGEAWIADPGRSPADAFFADAAREWELGTVTHGGPPRVTVHRLRATSP